MRQTTTPNLSTEFLTLRDENRILMQMLAEYFEELADIQTGTTIHWGHVGDLAFFKERLLSMLFNSRHLTCEEEATAEILAEMNHRLAQAGLSNQEHAS